MFTCTPFYLAAFVFLFEVSLLPFCFTHRFRFLRPPLVSPIGCLVLAGKPRAYSCSYILQPTFTLYSIGTPDEPNAQRAFPPQPPVLTFINPLPKPLGTIFLPFIIAFYKDKNRSIGVEKNNSVGKASPPTTSECSG